jgi:hypothetical protein
MIDYEAVEMFFAGLEETEMEKLIAIYENGDEAKLKANLDRSSIALPKEALMESLSMLADMKEMM